MEGIPLEQRNAILNAEIRRYTRSGYRVQHTTQTTAQLVKPKRFNLGIFILGLLLCILPGLIYWSWYLRQRGTSVYIEVDEGGKIRKR